MTTLDKIILDAIERAKERVRDEMLKAIELAGSDDGIRRLVLAEAERLLREDPEVREKLRAALIAQLDRPRRWT